MKYESRIKWKNGNEELLPEIVSHENFEHFVVETDGYTYICFLKTILYRKGTKAEPQGEWFRWKLSVSNELFIYLNDYAQSKSDEPIKTETHEQTVFNKSTVTHRINFPSTNYFISSNPKWHSLPYNISSVSDDMRKVTFSHKKKTQSLPSNFELASPPKITHKKNPKIISLYPTLTPKKIERKNWVYLEKKQVPENSDLTRR